MSHIHYQLNQPIQQVFPKQPHFHQHQHFLVHELQLHQFFLKVYTKFSVHMFRSRNYCHINEEEELNILHIILMHLSRKDIQEEERIRCYILIQLSQYFHQFFQHHIKLFELIILVMRIKPMGKLRENHLLYWN